MTTTLDDRVVTARTAHRCSSCGRDIAAGEKYRRQRIIGDDPFVWKACEQCDILSVAVWGNDIDVRADDDGLDPYNYVCEYAQGTALHEAVRTRWSGTPATEVPALIAGCEPLQALWREQAAWQERVRGLQRGEGRPAVGGR